MALINIVPIYKKQIKELKALSLVLFVSVGILILFAFLYLDELGVSKNPEQTDLSILWEFKIRDHAATSLSVFLTGYCF